LRQFDLTSFAGGDAGLYNRDEYLVQSRLAKGMFRGL
jgi:hypothetical protein